MAPSALELQSAAILAESLLTGAFAVLTAVVLWLLITRRRTMPTAHKILFGASVVMFAITVAHLALVFEENTSSVRVSWKNPQARIVLAVLQFVIGDLILIWRVWVVWGHNYLVIAPPLIIMLIASSFTLKVASDLYLITHKSLFAASAAGLLVANTSICTLLIIGKIWYARRELRKITPGHAQGFNGTILLFVESGALYAAAQICSLILNHVKNAGLHILLDLEIPLIGILPTLIIVVVHFGLVGVGGPPSAASDRQKLGSMKFEPRGRVFVETDISTFTAHSNARSADMTREETHEKVYDVRKHSEGSMV